MRKSIRTLALIVVSLVMSTTYVQAAPASQGYWQDTPHYTLKSEGPSPASYRSLTLDFATMMRHLQAAHALHHQTTVLLPQPEGGFATFTIINSDTLPPELQARYPDILSFRGHDKQGRQLRLDVSPMGLRAMVFDPDGIWVVQPEQRGKSAEHYLSFRRSALPDSVRRKMAPQGNDVIKQTPGNAPTGHQRPSSTTTGANKRLYRIAVAANHQYVNAVGGGTVAGGLATVTAAINRVNEIYGSELAIHLQLVANNDLLIYTNAATDPFGANDGSVINISTSKISNIIGVTNYDIGHVFTTGSGGVAGMGVVCSSYSKGRGTTGLPNPIGDAFYVDFVSHEIGHQFHANHTFNSTMGNCGGGNRNASTAYEPGSGSTIMGYAGICGGDDLQPHSNPYFHAISLQEISSFIQGYGGSCAQVTTNPNPTPVIDAGSVSTPHTIPAGTPFRLDAMATSPDGSSLSYGWEEFDLGPAASLANGDNGQSPILRSFSPEPYGWRVFPALSTVLGGPAVKGETLPSTNRTLQFRLTVRDPEPGEGTTAHTDTQLTVTTSAGPFKVTAPAGNVAWTAGQTQTVTWNVANTTAAPVSCPSVDIDFSIQGGHVWSIPLVHGTANDGSANITVPGINTADGRVRVICSNNVFFNVSQGNITITGGEDEIIFQDGFEAPCTPQQLLQDTSFEATGGGNPIWAITGAPYSPMCNTGCGTSAHTGTWYIWFGGVAEANANTVSQQVVIPAGASRWLNYWSRNLLGNDPTAAMQIFIDEELLDTVDGNDARSGWGHDGIAIPAQYLDGATHTIKFSWNAASPTGQYDGIIMDDVTLGCGAPTP